VGFIPNNYDSKIIIILKGSTHDNNVVLELSKNSKSWSQKAWRCNSYTSHKKNSTLPNIGFHI
jgi:hypothetical protein